MQDLQARECIELLHEYHHEYYRELHLYMDEFTRFKQELAIS